MRIFITLAAVAALASTLCALPASAQTFTSQTILSTANLHGAGRTGGAATPAPAGAGGGTVAPTFSLTAGTSRILTFSSVTGSITYDGGTFNNPDGVGNTNSTNFNAYQGISGVSFPNRAGYLLGVFIAGAPSGFADFSSGSAAANTAYTTGSVAGASFTPQLNQAFFIGDGLTGNGTGTVQQFFVPNTATTLVLGFEDAPAYNGDPGSFSDNSGSFTASFAVSGVAVPEAGTVVLALPGFALLGGLVLRRARKTA